MIGPAPSGEAVSSGYVQTSTYPGCPPNFRRFSKVWTLLSESVTQWIELRDKEKVMPAIGEDDPGRSYRRGYQDGAVETFRAIERFLDVATREVVHTWIEQDELVFDAQCPLRVKSGGDHQGVSLRMSALPPKADKTAEASRCPLSANSGHFALQQICYSITSSARCWRNQGTSRPSALAVLRLITSSNFVGCSTGRSAGLAPLRILPI